MSCVFLTNKSDFHRNIYSYLLLSSITASCDGVTASSIRCCQHSYVFSFPPLLHSGLGPCPLSPPSHSSTPVCIQCCLYSSQPSSNITGGDIRCEAMENYSICVLLLWRVVMAHGNWNRSYIFPINRNSPGPSYVFLCVLAGQGWAESSAARHSSPTPSSGGRLAQLSANHSPARPLSTNQRRADAHP